MTEKEIKARYKRAAFGFLWIVINPVLQMLVIGFVFSYFIEVENYYLFLISGLLPWGFFNLSLSKATSALVYERSLLKKSDFPKEVILISIILANFFHLLIGVSLVLIFLTVKGDLDPNWWLILPALLWLLMFTIGTSLSTASLNVRYRDVAFFVQSILVLWFYMTPVVYGIGLLPNSLAKVIRMNPLATIFEMIHLALLGNGKIDGQTVLVNGFVGAGVFLIGLVIFAREKKYFVDWL